jgi:hypothetical protein
MHKRTMSLKLPLLSRDPIGSHIVGTAVLFLLVTVFWFVFTPQVSSSAFGRVPYLDEVIYLDRAAAIMSPDTRTTPPLMMAPLYPYLIAATSGIAPVQGQNVFDPATLQGVRSLQIICWYGTLALLLVAGRRAARMWTDAGKIRAVVGWTPAVGFALYQPAAVFALSILAETILVFLVTLVVCLILHTLSAEEGRPRYRLLSEAILVGLALGMGVLLRGTCSVLLPLALFAFWRGCAPRQDRILAMGLAVAVFGGVLVPAIVHNSSIAGHLSGPTFNAGMNLYIGNGPSANGFYVKTIPGDLRLDPAGTQVTSTWVGRESVTVPESDSIWRKAALREMKNHPGRTALLWGRKVWLHLQAAEIYQITSQESWRAEFPLLTIMVVPYGMLAALGLTGLALQYRSRSVWWVGAALILLIGGQSFFFVVSRYRQVLVPLLALLAGAGMASILRRPRTAVIVLVAALLAVVPWGLGPSRAAWTQIGLANTAQRWAVLGSVEEKADYLNKAESMFRQSLTAYNKAFEPWLGLATLLDSQGRTDEAVNTLTQGVATAIQTQVLRNTLVRVLVRSKQYDAALVQVEAALVKFPNDPDQLHYACFLLSEKGLIAESQARAQALIDFHPRDYRGYANLGIIMARQGKIAAGRAAVEAGLQVLPGNADLLRHLSRFEGEQ